MNSDILTRVPRVSVVTVTLDARAFLEDTIESVLSQTHPDLEYIIIDGGSVDGTVDLLKSYGSRLAHWISEPDRGIADAFNKGLSRSTGDYILFLNSDDRLASSDSVERMMRAAQEAGSPEIIYGDCNLVERETGRLLRRVSIPFVPRAFKLGRVVPHPALFMNRSYISKYGTFDTSFRIGMDYELLLRGIFECRVVHVPEVVTVVRSGGLSARQRDIAAQEIVRALRKNGIIRTSLGEWAMRGYFEIRRLLRPIRQWMAPRS